MKLRLLLAAAAACAVVVGTPADARDRWTKAQAEQWYDAQPWMVGSNYNPATAINQLEMWQAATFDPATIDKELGWAEQLGMTTMRVYLHNLLGEDDAEGLKTPMNVFLTIAAKHHHNPLFSFFYICRVTKIGRD